MNFEFSFDPTEYLRIYKRALVDAFIIMNDFAELESELNILGISCGHGETED